ncbi:MAG: FRG domain-containing protein, partial [Burkholderiaceae bacterium]|nr:FRG domain-containing protein [Burkholderiaceae bacterium]
MREYAGFTSMAPLKTGILMTDGTTFPTISSLDEYLNHVNRKFDSDSLPPILFRGQREDWSLLSRLARIKPKKCFEFVKNNMYQKIEDQMLKEFKRRAVNLDYKIKIDWDWLALAQHHGMATRLLDWTENPLVALWFAVRNPVKDKNKSGVVWVLNNFTEYYIDYSFNENP